jgi:hypothetical protein
LEPIRKADIRSSGKPADFETKPLPRGSLVVHSINVTNGPPTPRDLPPWRAMLFDGHSISFASSAETFFRVAIEPACIAVAAEVDREPRGSTDASIDRWEEARVAQLELHRSMALSLGGLWERNFRSHLWNSVAILDPGNEKRLALTQGGTWHQICRIFEQLRGFPLSRFPTYGDLDLLQVVSSAARHGNGSALSKLYATRQDLFLEDEVTVSWFSYLTLGGEPPDTIRKLEITLPHLRMFKDAIVGFWLTIGELQASDT